MFFAALLVLVLSFGFAVYYVLSSLDGLVKSAIETYGSQATQTTVRVEGVQIVLKDGSGAIRGLTVANPPGYEAQQAFSLGEISTQVNLKSLSEEVTVIDHIIVRAPQVFFELNEAGKNNLAELKQRLSSGASRSASSSPGGGTESRLIIRKLLFIDGTINASVVPLDKDYELKLPKLELYNLGGKNGATQKEIANQVLDKLTKRALAEIEKKGLDQYKTKLEGKIRNGLKAEQNKIGEKVGDQFKEVFSY